MSQLLYYFLSIDYLKKCNFLNDFLTNVSIIIIKYNQNIFSN